MSTVTQLKFKNGHTYPVISINSNGTQYIQGQSRQCIDVQFVVGQFDAVKADAILAGNLDTLTITEDTTDDTGKALNKEWVHNHYNIVQHIGINSYTVKAASDASPEVTESRTSLLVAQLTYLEVQQVEQAKAIAELSAMVAGGVK